jgi:hypothetical protein
MVRFFSSEEVYCQPVAATTAEESETRWLGRFRDVFPGGLSLVLRRRFEPGTALTVELSNRTKRGVRSFHLQVVRSTTEGKNRWIIECEFLSPLSTEQVQALITE